MTALHRTRVKICGITRETDATYAAHCGADAIGLVFADSPRRVNAHTATAVLQAIPPFVSVVGVFADQPVAMIEDTVDRCALPWVQLSGNETPHVAGALRRPVIKAVHMHSSLDLETYASYPARAFLLDAPATDSRMGGTGEVFDWRAARKLPWDRKRVIVAGGLTPDNVGAVIAQLRPAAVDVSSGVESEPGVKDPEKVAAFVAAVREADSKRPRSQVAEP